MSISVARVVMALAVTVGSATTALGQSFTDDPLTVGTPVKAVHVTELRTAVANLRAFVSLPVFPFTDPAITPTVTPIRAVHIEELRSALNDVYDAAAKPHPPYTDPALTGVAIKAVHITELRAAVFNAINDAPAFTKGADQTVSEDAGAQTVPGWATAISAGLGETTQTVTFVIDSNNNPGLFSAAPSVASNGTLTYTPGANQNGAATITLHAHDNGGTGGGGVDNSPTQSFTITVTAINDAPVVTNKTYGPNAVQANMKIIGLTGLLAGVTDADSGVNLCNPTFTVTNVSGTTPAGGAVTLTNASTGTFDFDPPPGATGNVTFTYTVQDTGCPGTATSAAATVTMNVAGPVIWFVNAAVVGPGDGRLSNPFKTLASADAVDNVNHRVFLYTGTYVTGLALNSGESLIGQGVSTASDAGFTSFDAVFGITPPLGTAARPAIAGTRPTVQGTVTLNTGSAVRGLNLSTGGSAGMNDPAGAVTGVAVSEVTVTTTGIAVNLTDADGAFSFTAINANGGTNGIVWSNPAQATGSFIVTGTGTAGTGGTIQNTTTRGASFINARNITLKYLNFTNAATADFPAAPTGLSLGNNTGDNAAIHLETVTNVTLDTLNINGSAEQGINGHNVTTFVLKDSTLLNLGQGADEDGLHFFNMLGTCSITNTTFTSSGDDNVNIQNNTNLALPAGMTAVTALTITNGSANTGVLGSGYLMGIRGTSNTTVTIDGVTADNNFSGGIVIDTFDNATSSIEVKNSSSTNNNDGISLSSDNGSTKFDIHDNVSFAGTDFGRINILKAACPAPCSKTAGVLQGKIRNNPIVVTDGQAADGITVFQAGDGTLTVSITANTFDYRGTQRAINIQGGQDGSGQLNATVTGNNIDMKLDGTGNAVTGILAQVAVASPSGDNTNMCADIGGAGALKNVFTHTLGNNMAAGDMRLRQRFVTTVTLPGYAGASSDNAAVVSYLAGRNTLVNSPTATATNEIGVTVGAGGFVGGVASCPVPVFP